MSAAPIVKPDTETPQLCADRMREASVLLAPTHPELGVMLDAGASVIEGLCDVIARQHATILELAKDDEA